MKKQLAGAALCASAIVATGGSAFAGEVTGSGKGGPAGDGVPGGIGRAASACVFSGLEDFDGLQPVDPGAVQNWGHVDDDPAFIEIIESTGASHVVAIVDFGFGPFELETGCNPHSGGEG
jgi:hypothetical protein